ncbi:hypothetical protein Tco_0183419 [Tanacetum coccineum]
MSIIRVLSTRDEPLSISSSCFYVLADPYQLEVVISAHADNIKSEAMGACEPSFSSCNLHKSTEDGETKSIDTEVNAILHFVLQTSTDMCQPAPSSCRRHKRSGHVQSRGLTDHSDTTVDNNETVRQILNTRGGEFRSAYTKGVSSAYIDLGHRNQCCQHYGATFWYRKYLKGIWYLEICLCIILHHEDSTRLSHKSGILLHSQSLRFVVTSYGVANLLIQDDLALWAVLGSILNVLLSFTPEQLINQERSRTI